MNQHQSAKGQSVLAFLSEKRMQMQTSAPVIQTERKFSQQMRAVLLVLNADPFLMEAVAPFINKEEAKVFNDQAAPLSPEKRPWHPKALKKGRPRVHAPGCTWVSEKTGVYDQRAISPQGTRIIW